MGFRETQEKWASKNEQGFLTASFYIVPDHKNNKVYPILEWSPSVDHGVLFDSIRYQGIIEPIILLWLHFSEPSQHLLATPACFLSHQTNATVTGLHASFIHSFLLPLLYHFFRTPRALK